MTVPIVGTAGLDHEHSAAMEEAATWLTNLEPHEKPQPVIPELRRRFGLSPLEACQAIAEANLRRARASR
ncbi:hypothetical protein SAMN05428963_10631 [Consotaella salsifontis]|uniref:Uncharacterized protein n=1 Tax=Consotaella salsifontis TaxID=1365950 RepID=A0A1T4R596_9HYPH|nr:hypothetical protein [Consotaella salsifontis]SKA11099.1 hypothetical protein SAMN05428963_10631 [Consotaella salsifontis]